MDSLASTQLSLATLLEQKSLTITTAESCTAGGISHALTDLAGSSAYFNQAFITYSNEAKQQMLGVKPATLNAFGAVSKQTVFEMAEGALIRANADVAIAVSGIAGPGGGSESKPVGTVWFAIAMKRINTETEEGKSEVITTTFKQLFTGDRGKVRSEAVKFALKQLVIALS